MQLCRLYWLAEQLHRLIQRGVFMQDILTLQELPMGQMGEIVSLSEEHQNAIYHELGAGVGMTVMVLQKAVNWLVQIGYSQVDVGSNYLQHIKVKPIGI